MSKYRIVASLSIGEIREDNQYVYSGGSLNGSVTFDTKNLDFQQLGKLMEAFHQLQADWTTIAEVQE